MSARPPDEAAWVIELDAEVLEADLVWVELPLPPAGRRWTVEWRVVGCETWHTVGAGLDDGGHLVRDTSGELDWLLEWRAVAEPCDPLAL